MLNPPSPAQWKLVPYYSSYSLLSFNLQHLVLLSSTCLMSWLCTCGLVSHFIEFVTIYLFIYCATVHEIKTCIITCAFLLFIYFIKMFLLVFCPCRSVGGRSPHRHQNESSVAGLAAAECVSIICYCLGTFGFECIRSALLPGPRKHSMLSTSECSLTNFITSK